MHFLHSFPPKTLKPGSPLNAIQVAATAITRFHGFGDQPHQEASEEAM